MRKWLFRLIKLPPRFLYAIGLGPIYGRLVLLLTTKGRKTGQRRITPLQYEEIGDDFVIGSARGVAADWYRNIVADPTVEVQVKRRRFTGIATTSTVPEQVADFLELRLRRHPKMVGRIMRMKGAPADPTRADLEAYARGSAIVTITPRQSPL